MMPCHEFACLWGRRRKKTDRKPLTTDPRTPPDNPQTTTRHTSKKVQSPHGPPAIHTRSLAGSHPTWLDKWSPLGTTLSTQPWTRTTGYGPSSATGSTTNCSKSVKPGTHLAHGPTPSPTRIQRLRQRPDQPLVDPPGTTCSSNPISILVPTASRPIQQAKAHSPKTPHGPARAPSHRRLAPVRPAVHSHGRSPSTRS